MAMAAWISCCEFQNAVNHCINHQRGNSVSHPKLDEIPIAERDTILKAFFKEGAAGPLNNYPAQDKKKLVILAHLAGMFEGSKTYTALEVNQKLKSRFEDPATLRRDLIEFGFFERSPDGREYRRLV
jgi:hypothetical protein